MYTGLSPSQRAFNFLNYTATGGETALPILGEVNNVLVRNGALLTPGTDYSRDTGTGQITLTNAALAGDEFTLFNMSLLQFANMALKNGDTTQRFKVLDAQNSNEAASLGQLQNRAGSAGSLNFRNKIVDGRFDFWYEGTSQTTAGYGSSTMWFNQHIGSTKTVTRQSLVAGVDLPSIEVPSATYFHRTVVVSVTATTNNVLLFQHIEDVRTLSGKTVTLSFYAKADSTKNIGIELNQQFGAGGSSAVTGIGAQLVQLTTSWQRFTRTFNIPSVSGKTIGTNNLLELGFWFEAGSDFSSQTTVGQQSGTFDIACVQLEEGSVATPFEELPNDVAQLRVNRYFVPFDSKYLIAMGPTAHNFIGGSWRLPTTMRTMPTFTFKDETGNISRVSTLSNGQNVSVLVGSIAADTQTVYADALLNANSANWVKFFAQCDARL